MLGHEFQVEVIGHFDIAQVYLEDFLTLLEFWQFHMDLAVEATGAHERLVQDIGPVGGGQYDDTAVGAEAVHFRKQLVQRVFTFVVGGEAAVLGAGAAYGINLVDEHDARSFFLGLAEEVAHAGGTYAHEHLHEVGAADAEERYVGPPCYGFGQEGLTRSGRAHQEGALGDFAAQGRVFLRILEEIHNLHHLFLGAIQACYVLESDFHVVFIGLTRVGLAGVEGIHAASAAGTAHPPVHSPEQ